MVTNNNSAGNDLMIVLSATYHLSTVQWIPTMHLSHLLLVKWILYTVHMAAVHMAPANYTLSNFNLLCGKVAEISQYLPKTLMCQRLMAAIKNSPVM